MTEDTGNRETAAVGHMEAKLSRLWIFVMFNYLYCDVIALMDPMSLKQIMSGTVGSMQINQEFLLGAAVLMEIPIAMVLLSRVLKHKINRGVNIIAGMVMTVVQVSSLFVGTPPTPYYVFFSTIEITCTSLIVWCAWKWKPAAEISDLPHKT